MGSLPWAFSPSFPFLLSQVWFYKKSEGETEERSEAERSERGGEERERRARGKRREARAREAVEERRRSGDKRNGACGAGKLHACVHFCFLLFGVSLSPPLPLLLSPSPFLSGCLMISTLKIPKW